MSVAMFDRIVAGCMWAIYCGLMYSALTALLYLAALTAPKG